MKKSTGESNSLEKIERAIGRQGKTEAEIKAAKKKREKNGTYESKKMREREKTRKCKSNVTSDFGYKMIV